MKLHITYFLHHPLFLDINYATYIYRAMKNFLLFIASENQNTVSVRMMQDRKSKMQRALVPQALLLSQE